MRARLPRNKQRWLLAGSITVVLILIICRLIVLVQEAGREAFPPRMISVLDANGAIISVDLEQYLIGVVAAEMPASFAPEAIKAQAVAARTYILRRVEPYGVGKHGEAAVCGDPTCCQAYDDIPALQQRWGLDYEYYYQRISEAVQDTRGQVLTWHGMLAETPFSSTCGGSTESAAAVWGGRQAYLVPVDCDWDSHSPRFVGFKQLALTEAASLLDVTVQDLYAMRVCAYTDGGRVARLEVGDRQIAGTELRSLLALNSAAFSWLILGDHIVFTTVGYGHGVGLCQYGADGMARADYDYTEILAHYYPGTKLMDIEDV